MPAVTELATDEGHGELEAMTSPSDDGPMGSAR